MYCQLEEGGLVYVHSAICETFWCSSILYIYDQLERSTSALSICALCYMLNIFSVVVLHRSMVNWRRASPWYMCIMLSVKSFWCSSIPYIYVQLEGGPSALSLCAFCYMWNFFGVAVFHTCMVNWREVHLH